VDYTLVAAAIRPHKQCYRCGWWDKACGVVIAVPCCRLSIACLIERGGEDRGASDLHVDRAGGCCDPWRLAETAHVPIEVDGICLSNIKTRDALCDGGAIRYPGLRAVILAYKPRIEHHELGAVHGTRRRGR
jgi:hypothetical protein